MARFKLFGRKPKTTAEARPADVKASSVIALEMRNHVGQAVWTGRNFRALSKEGYEKCVVVYSCVHKIAQAVSTVPIKAVRDGADGPEDVPNHPLIELLWRPCPNKSGQALLYELTSFLALAGNAYLEGVGPDNGPNRGRYLELWAKRPDRMKVVAGPAGVAAYEYQVNGANFRWPVDPVSGRGDILHMRLFSPLDDFYGLSPLEAAAMATDQHNGYAEWNFNMLQNGGFPPWLLTTEPGRELSDLQLERLKAEIKDNLAGARNAGRAWLAEGVKPVPLGFAPREMEWIEGKNVSAREIALAFGVPSMLLGIPGDNTYSNQQEARLAFYEETVLFYVETLINGINSWLDWGDGVYLAHDLSAVPALAARRNALWERARAADFLTINERRQLVGRPPLPGGDALLVPATNIPLEAAGEMPDQDQAAKAELLRLLVKAGRGPEEAKRLADVAFAKGAVQ